MQDIRNITVSGRIASGTTTLAQGIADILGWKLLEGGALFEEYHKKLGVSESQADMRPDEYDLQFEDMIKKKLRDENNIIIQSHLAGFDAQNIPGVYKILCIVEDEKGVDHPDIRVDRLVNRKGIPVTEAKKEVKEREENNLEKWRRLYADNDPHWIYWDKKYYDLVINTYSLNKQEALDVALTALGITQ